MRRIDGRNLKEKGNEKNRRRKAKGQRMRRIDGARLKDRE